MNRWILSSWLILIAILAVTAVWLRHDEQSSTSDQSVRIAAVAAATTSAEKLLSYRAGTVSADLHTSERLLAEPFKSKFASVMSTIVTSAKKGQISTSAVVSAAGVVKTSGRSHVVVLLFVNQNTTSGQSLTPKQQGSRIKVTVIKNGGRWLISELKAI